MNENEILMLLGSAGIEVRKFTFDGGQVYVVSSPYGSKRVTVEWGEDVALCLYRAVGDAAPAELEAMVIAAGHSPNHR